MWHGQKNKYLKKKKKRVNGIVSSVLNPCGTHKCPVNSFTIAFAVTSIFQAMKLRVREVRLLF